MGNGVNKPINPGVYNISASLGSSEYYTFKYLYGQLIINETNVSNIIKYDEDNTELVNLTGEFSVTNVIGFKNISTESSSIEFASLKSKIENYKSLSKFFNEYNVYSCYEINVLDASSNSINLKTREIWLNVS